MKQTKNILSWLIIALNIVGVVCLIYFAIPYFTHNVTITNPDAMLPAEAWDRAGMVLTFGFIPLLVADIFCSVVVKTKQKFVSFLYFIPSVVCLIIVLSYLILGHFCNMPHILLFCILGTIILVPMELGMIIWASKKEYGTCSLKSAFEGQEYCMV